MVFSFSINAAREKRCNLCMQLQKETKMKITSTEIISFSALQVMGI